ncbi:MAG: hypothetical protein ACI9MF_001423, partial [Gammaproteobacteria bacterium]
SSRFDDRRPGLELPEPIETTTGQVFFLLLAPSHTIADTEKTVTGKTR